MRTLLAVLGLAAALGAQTLDRVAEEAEKLRGSKLPLASDWNGDIGRNAPLRDALRHWIEARLPESRSAMEAALPALEASLRSEIERAKLTRPAPDTPAQPDDSPFGYVEDVTVTRPPEAPGVVIVQSGVSVHCGSEDDVYVYDYADNRRRTVLELSLIHI